MSHEVANWVDFITAGKSIFTIRNDDTGNRFTFRVKKIEDAEKWFVSVLNGSDNNSHYTYMGLLEGKDFRRTVKSKVSEISQAFKTFTWLVNRMNTGGLLPRTVKFFHEGRCGRCGRRLTVPESIEAGYGPECVKRIGLR